MTVNVLGVKYTVVERTEKQEPALRDINGFTDFSVKKIALKKFVREYNSIEDFDQLKRETLRHELIHAFLYESGLGYSSNNSWAVNEEMVDWFAIQFPKIFKLFSSLGILT